MNSSGLLLAIGGPTASGKTSLAVSLAQQLEGEIVNADSRQIYRGMNIGTAKPDELQRRLIAHHLLDVAAPDEHYTLALYVRHAHQAIREIQARGKLPILVGGTGLYLRAVRQGYAVPEVAPNPDLRRDLETEAALHGLHSLVERLRELDPEGAERIDARNLRRVIRALEVSLATGAPFSSFQRRSPPYRSLAIILTGTNTLLFERADSRLTTMLQAGFVDEVAALQAAGYGPDLPAMSALGYRELARYLQGESTLDAAIEATRTSTHAFIRRQRTWFRAEPDAHLLAIAEPALPQCALALASDWREAQTG